MSNTNTSVINVSRAEVAPDPETNCLVLRIYTEDDEMPCHRIYLWGTAENGMPVIKLAEK